jgi:hypothetical protein
LPLTGFKGCKLKELILNGKLKAEEDPYLNLAGRPGILDHAESGGRSALQPEPFSIIYKYVAGMQHDIRFV